MKDSMLRSIELRALLAFAVTTYAVEIPSSFPDVTAAIQWACRNVDSTPNVQIIQTESHQVLAIWGKPNAITDETPVLTLIKGTSDPAIPFVRFENLESWEIDVDGEPTEHFGIIQYDKDSDLVSYHTNVKRQLLIQSLPVAECYNAAAKKALTGTP